MEDGSGEVLPGQEFEVEHILKYRKHTDGQEYFLIKWVGYSVEEATWEPLHHLNDNCRELIVKARALFAFKRPGADKARSEPAVATQPTNVAPGLTNIAPPQEATIGTTVATTAATTVGTSADTVGQEGANVEVQQEAVEEPMTLPNVDVDLEPVGDEDVTAPPADSRQATDQPQPPPLEPQQVPREPAVEDGGVIVDIGDDDDEEQDEDQDEGEGPDELGFEEAGAATSPPVPPSGPPPSKRPKLQAPLFAPGGMPGSSESAAGKRPGAGSAAPSATGERAAPKAAAPTDEDPEPQPVAKKPVAREMKCICGAAEKVPPAARDKLVVCRICTCGLHPNCAKGSLQGGKIPDDYVCPPCRLERVDEFHPPVGTGLLRHSYASSSSTFTLSFQAQPSVWKKQSWAVHLRAVSLGTADLSGPAWPHRVQGKLNGRQCVAIDPPKHLHVRREQCYNLTPLLRPGVNQLELKFTPKPDKRDDEDESYCVGVVLTRPRNVTSIIARIRTRSTETVSSGQQRVRRLLAQTARKERNEDDCTVTGNFGRVLKPLCPVSLCPIEEAAIGRHCNHIQVFDLQAYIAVNQRMRSLDKRWTCPVCAMPLRPDDVVLDPFAQGILDTLRGDEELVEAVVFNEGCTWTTISAVKDSKMPTDDKDASGGDGGADGGEGGAGRSAELIDLSDDE